MIYGTLAHLEDLRGIHPNVWRGLQLLRSTDFSQLEDGRYDVDGEEVFFSLQSYETIPGKDLLEAHKKYVDIQFLISGQERMGVAPLETVGSPIESRPEGDIWFYRGPMDSLLLTAGRFAVVWPGDAHAPAIAVDGPEPCRKCIVKARVG